MDHSAEKESIERLEEKRFPLSTIDYVEDPTTERRITRKLDLHILPWIFALWLLAFIDRSNIGEHEITQHAFTISTLTLDKATPNSTAWSMIFTSRETSTTSL